MSQSLENGSVLYQENGSSPSLVPAQKRNRKSGSGKSSPQNPKAKGHQASGLTDHTHTLSNSTDIIRPNSVAVVANKKYSLIEDRVKADHCWNEELSPVPELAMKRTASDSMLLDRSMRDDMYSIEEPLDAQSEQVENSKKPSTPSPSEDDKQYSTRDQIYVHVSSLLLFFQDLPQVLLVTIGQDTHLSIS
jgi:hypothetical protein